MNETLWSTDGTDKNYQHYRTGVRWKDLRKWMDDSYFGRGLFQYLDKNFVDRLQNNGFFPRLWELEVADWLSLTGLKLIPTNGQGPDFCIELADKRKLWIEAVLSTPDEAMDESWRPRFGSPGKTQEYDTPKNDYWLRFGTSLYTKANKIKSSYIDKNIIGEDDLVFVAISAFPPGSLNGDIEFFMRAAFPIGDPVIHFSKDGKSLDPKIPRQTHTTVPSFTKENGTIVLKQFLYPGTHFPYIDGVFFTEASNLQLMLGTWSSRFDDSTNIPHVFPNHASTKILPSEFTDNFYLHKFTSGDVSSMTLEVIDPKKKLSY